jgi:hypothetical protein
MNIYVLDTVFFLSADSTIFLETNYWETAYSKCNVWPTKYVEMSLDLLVFNKQLLIKYNVSYLM